VVLRYCYLRVLGIPIFVIIAPVFDLRSLVFEKCSFLFEFMRYYGFNWSKNGLFY